jgi:hypothetical protein
MRTRVAPASASPSSSSGAPPTSSDVPAVVAPPLSVLNTLGARSLRTLAPSERSELAGARRGDATREGTFDGSGVGGAGVPTYRCWIGGSVGSEG